MIYDKGKLIISVVLIVGLLSIVGINTWKGVETDAQVWALLSAVMTYVFVNGKQLVSPFTPSPMIVPRPDRVAELVRKDEVVRKDEAATQSTEPF